MRPFSILLGPALLPLALGAAPYQPEPRLPALAPRVAATDTTPSVRWNMLAQRIVAQRQVRGDAARAAALAGDSSALRALPPVPHLGRLFALLSLAQFQALDEAAGARVSTRAAVAGASAGVLDSLFRDPVVGAAIAGLRAREMAAAARENRDAAEGGWWIGTATAARLLEWARSDRTDTPWTGTIPTGAGMWTSAPDVAPLGAAQPRWRPYLLTAADQFRPPPPPAWDSPAFTAALDEVRQVARDRTPEQTRIAHRWGLRFGIQTWNEVATRLLTEVDAPDTTAARALAMLNVAVFDALIGCWEAKYHYNLIRPSQADTSLALADSLGLPNFPAYPSGHACGAGAAEVTLAAAVPPIADEIHRLAEENAMSRLYAGVHFRFDNDVGLALGRAVGRYVSERERAGALRALGR